MDWKQLLSVRRLGTADGEASTVEATNKSLSRGEFDKDYGRAVFSSPVRRLQDKAQVFPMDPTDAVRTRLTHSMEVSSVARGLAHAVAMDEVRHHGLEPDMARDIETVAATAGLMHDLGTPPFGHLGEGAMRDWFNRKIGQLKDNTLTPGQLADLRNFEGNAQTIRLASRLQIIAKDEGMNLTCASLSALQKYAASSTSMSEDVHALSKPGFFESEKSVVEGFRRETGVPHNGRNPITLLMEAADDTCFLVVDLEDGVKKGVITWGEVANQFRECTEGEALANKTEDYIAKHGGSLDERAAAEAKAQMLRVYFIGEATEASRRAFADNRQSIMSGTFSDELIKVGSLSELVKKMKAFARQRVYSSAQILKLESRGRRVISDLMDYFWAGTQVADMPDRNAAKHAHGIPYRAWQLISPNYRRRYKTDSAADPSAKTYLRMQLVADQVCGMTDGFACRLHEDISGG